VLMDEADQVALIHPLIGCYIMIRYRSS